MSKEAPKDDVKEGLWDFMHEVVLAKQAAFERIICKCRCQSNGTKGFLLYVLYAAISTSSINGAPQP